MTKYIVEIMLSDQKKFGNELSVVNNVLSRDARN